MSEEIENRESRGEQKPSDVVVFSPEVLAMADRRRRQKAEELERAVGLGRTRAAPALYDVEAEGVRV